MSQESEPKPGPELEPEDALVLGWRYWYVKDALLHSRNTGLAWPRRQPMTYKVKPSLRGDVGVYAWKSQRRAEDALMRGKAPGPIVIGMVALWGDVAEHENGWRAEFAYPQSIIANELDPLVAMELESGYCVPFAYLTEVGEPQACCGNCGWPGMGVMPVTNYGRTDEDGKRVYSEPEYVRSDIENCVPLLGALCTACQAMFAAVANRDWFVRAHRDYWEWLAGERAKKRGIGFGGEQMA